MTQIEIAREYRIRHGMDMPTLTLARLMYKENIEVFKNVDSARRALRYIEGKNGKKSVKVAKGTPFYKEEARPLNPYKLPESEESKYEPFILKAKRLAVLSDIHVPYHSIEAVTAAFDKIKEEKPDAILSNILLGTWNDVPSATTWATYDATETWANAVNLGLGDIDQPGLYTMTAQSTTVDTIYNIHKTQKCV